MRAPARGKGIAVGLGLAGLAAARAALAQPDDGAVHLDYASSPGCPTEAAFFAEVTARTQLVHRVTGGESGRTLVVRLTKGPDESLGSFSVQAPGGGSTAREVAGDTCEEVASALALIVALTFDSNADPGPIAVPPPAASVAPPEDTPPPPPRAEPIFAAALASTDREPRRGRAPWRLAFTAGASVTGGVAPGSILGVPILVEAAAPAGGVLAPTVHLGFERAATATAGGGGPTASFTWTLGIVEGCPNRWTYGPLVLEPCVRFEVGALEGAGANITPAREDTRPWVAIGAVGRARWVFLPPMFVELEAGVRTPLVRTTYFFEPDTTIYAPPAAGGMASVGLGVRFL